MGTVRWRERRDGAIVPPLDDGLSGWIVERERASHVNARRVHAGREFHLKWFRHGVLGNPGRAEWRNAARIAGLGIPTVVAAGWGRHAGGSFVVLEGSPGLPGEAWMRSGGDARVLRGLARGLAAGVARMHDANLCHRDLNVYHVIVDGGDYRLIDVGRVMRFVRRRWIVKDLASLLASARREGYPAWSARLFLREYLKATTRHWSRRGIIRAALRKAERIRGRLERKGGE
jgi:tRNA A-37 threonylcarbamoyl transferase component Bud32